MSVEQVVRAFKAILEGPQTRMGLAEKTGVPHKTAGRLLAEMKKQKMIYVIDYTNETDGRNRVKIYALGDGEDAQPRQSQPQEERSRKSYAKRVRAIKAARVKTTFVGGVSLWQ